jgi:hypothetical protein
MPVVVDHRGVAIFLDRFAERLRIQPYVDSDPHEVARVFQPTGSLPMSLEQGMVHLLEPPMLAGELGGTQCAARVDDHSALLHGQPDLGGDVVEVTAHLIGPSASEIRLERNPLDWSLRVKLEWPPRDADEIFPFQLVDSDRVDVAPGSNVVGKDDQLDRLANQL